MAEFAQFDPKKITGAFAGIIARGFADGTFITAKKTTPTWGMKSGSQADVVRNRSNDDTGTVEFVVLASSSMNSQMRTRAKLDKLTGTGYGPLLIQDLNGTTVIRSSRAWIRTDPDVEMSTEGGEITWTVDCADLQIEPGSAAIV